MKSLMNKPKKAQEQQFLKDLKEMKRLINIWRKSQLFVKVDSSEKAILIQYSKYLQHNNNIDALKGPVFIKSINYKQDLKDINQEKNIFLGISLLQHKQWKVNFNKKFIKKLRSLSEQTLIDIFLRLRMLAEGFINFAKGKSSSLQEYQRVSEFNLKYYTQNIQIDNDIYFIVFSIGINQLPQYNFKGGELQRFIYLQVITCEDLIHHTIFYNQKKINQAIDSIQSHYEDDPKLSYLKQDLIIDKESQNESKKDSIISKKKKKTDESIIKPKKYRSKAIIKSKDCQINLQVQNFRFLFKKHQEYQIRNQYLQNLQQQNTMSKLSLTEQLERQTAKNQKIQFKDYTKIVEILQKIPNFKFLLTKQQRQVLCQSGNLIVVGRSGTGKTTCAMLRLYGIEMSIKDAYYNQRVNQLVNQQECKMMILDKIHPTKSIFLTFSGILIDQINKQYEDMLYQIKEKHSEKCQKCQFIIKKIKDEKDIQDPLDKLKKIEEEQEKKVVSLRLLKQQDYPGFFTIENFIKIIDKTLKRHFFSHRKGINIQKMAQIKQTFINRYQYGVDNIKISQIVKAVYVDYNFFFRQIWDHLPKQLTRNSKQFCLLTPSTVWSEIFSILKGSINSYLCPDGYISLKMYLQNTQSIFNSQLQKAQSYKKKVYKILKNYVQWCRVQKAYDLMDVVSHNLRQIEFYGYNGPKINYMFVDQVQDLTASTTLLISKMVINNIFYCGDTAQAITKGVSFRFEELKLLYNSKYYKYALNIEPPSDIQTLTVNFRSHNSILQLANSIVSSIQIFFPNTIHKLKKEKSDLIGPKPFIILNQDQSLIFDLVCGSIQQNKLEKDIDLRQIVHQSQSKNFKSMNNQKRKKNKKGKKNQQIDQQDQSSKDPRKFNNQQVIIVRNTEQQQKLPSILKKGIILTPQKAKGLQFDQIILYNFFGSSQILDKWNHLFQHLQCVQQYQDQKSFQQNLSRRNQQQQQKQQQPLPIQVKILLGYDPNKKIYINWILRAKQSLKGLIMNAYHEIATQLKILYTAVTRARSVFIIFDTKIPKILSKIWEKMNLITYINESNVKQHYESIFKYVKVNQKHIKYINQNKHWFKAGCEMLARKDYENAKKCYQNIQRIDLVQRIQALQEQIKAQNQLYRIKSQMQKISTLGKDDKKIVKARLQKQKKQVYKIYLGACKVYQKYHRYNDLAQVYFKIENYQLALKYYRLANNVDNSLKIAVCCKKLKRFNEALSQFEENEDFQGIIQCYIELKEWRLLFNIFTSHPEEINKKYNLKECIKNVLNQIINKKRLQSVLYVSDQQRRIYDQESFHKQINKIIKESDKEYVSFLKQKLVAEDGRYRQIQKTHHFFAREYQKLSKQHLSKEQEKNKIENEFKALCDDIQLLKSNLQKYKQYVPAQLKSNKQYQSTVMRLKVAQKERPELYEEKCRLIQELSIIQKDMENKKQIMNKFIDQLNELDQIYDYRNIKKDLAFIEGQSRIKYYQLQQKVKLTTFQNTKKPAQIISNSQIQSQQNKYKQLLSQIKQILKISQKIINYDLKYQYAPLHHRFIEQKLFRALSDCQGIQILKKCNFVGDNRSCIKLCLHYKKLIALLPIFIFGYLLQFSNNVKEQRYFKSQIYQTQFQETQKEKDINIDEILGELSKQCLQHKIPRIKFQNSFYYQPIASNLVFGLILQGYIKQATSFLDVRTAWRLSYLFSVEECMEDLLKRMTSQLGQLIFRNHKFLFIDDDFILWKFPQARQLNIFSMQKLFFKHDECQSQTFLSKKVESVQFQIEQDEVTRLYNEQAPKKIQKMKREKKINQQKIHKIQQQIRSANFMIQKTMIQLPNIDKQNNIFRKNRREVCDKIQQNKQTLKQLQKQLLIAKLNLDRAKMSKKQKIAYEQDIKRQQQLSNKSGNQIYQTKELFDLRNQYRAKIDEQRKTYETYEQIQYQISMTQKALNSNVQKNLQLKQNINQNQQKLLLFPQQKMVHQKFISQKEYEIKVLKESISQDIDILGETELIQQVVKKLMKELKNEKWQKYRYQLRQAHHMDKILFESNIPKTHSYSFIKMYLKGTSIKDYSSIEYRCQIYYRVLEDSLRLEELQKNGELVQLANVIIFYLSYIFNKSFREDTESLLEIMIEEMQSDYQNKLMINQSIINIQNQIEYFKRYENLTPFLIQQKRQNQILLEQYNYELYKPARYNYQPRKLFNNLITSVFKKIQYFTSTQDKFLSILFGFFQCKIVTECQPLEYLKDQYVLVRFNSIILQKLKQHKFVYYFDQFNKNVLCRFKNVYPAILNYITENHLILFNQTQYSQQKVIETINNKLFFKQLYQTKKPQENLEDAKTIIKINKFICQSQKQDIQRLHSELFVNIYELVSKIKQEREQHLEYYLKNKLQDTQSYHFFHFQIRQNYFLQKMLTNIRSFNYDLFKNIKKKKQILQKQYKMFMSSRLMKITAK